MSDARKLLENQKANREREPLSQEANLTDRFAKAVEQLASSKLEVRLGAIFALERLARDSKRDHAPIMELLTAYVRERAPRQDGEGQDQQDDGRVAARPATDIQAGLTVISRRPRWFGQGESIPLDLSRTRLARANLGGVHLGGALLGEASRGWRTSGGRTSGKRTSGRRTSRGRTSTGRTSAKPPASLMNNSAMRI